MSDDGKTLITLRGVRAVREIRVVLLVLLSPLHWHVDMNFALVTDTKAR